METRRREFLTKAGLSMAGAAVFAVSSGAQTAQPDQSSAAADGPPSNTSWFLDAGLGLFVHFGIASVGGHQDLSWAMIKDAPWNKNNVGVMTPNAYYAMAERFKAGNFDPNRWLKAAREAGFGYAVLTTRHHEGFALWPSAFGELNTKNFMGGRDLVKEFVEACRGNGLKAGLYYSSPDWYRERAYKSWGYGTKGTPDSPHLDMDHRPVASLPVRPSDFDGKNAAYLNGQLQELLSNYGPIDYLWFDGSAKGVMSQEEIRKLQPGIIVNDRQHHGGDVITDGYEARLPVTRPTRLWEHCFSMVGAWGYTKPVHCQPPETIEEKLARTRTWGGNVLANFGPQPDGEMPPEYYQCLAGLKAWMDWAAPAVIRVTPGPYPEKCNVPVTVKGKIWFAFLLPKTRGATVSDETISITGTGQPRRVILLHTGAPLETKVTGDQVVIGIPQNRRTGPVDIVEIAFP